MVSPLIKMYVAIRSLKETQKQLDEIFDFYNKSIDMDRNVIKFSFLAFYPTILGAGSLIKNRIYVSAEWAATLIFNRDDATLNAFNLTIGHELSHKDGDFAVWYWERESKQFIRKKDRKFVNWVTEVHHDFFAAEKMVDSNKEKLLASMDYKIKLKPNNEDRNTHPSWKQRKEYAKTGAFNKALIEEIAKQTGCTNDKLINEISKFYGDIVLKD
ncbi:MAG: hypothetical protein E7244_27880 [Enterocloster citroniae]|nr:hypothetical protein [Enterocloster citroniae]